MIKPKTVILWGRDDVLSRSIELLLSEMNGWEVITISDAQSPKDFLQLVEKYDPKVIIIHQGDSSICIEGETELLLHLIQHHPDVKVITISLENNAMEVFNKQEVQVKGVSDLLSIVEGSP